MLCPERLSWHVGCMLCREATNPEDPHDVAEVLKRAVQHGLFLQQLQESTSECSGSA